jgi:hypothetical protein
MKNLSGIVMLFLLCPLVPLFSQQLTPFVISSSGGFYSNTSGMLSFTTGEMAAVETYSNSTSILTQGFQQPWDFGTYINEHPFNDFSFGIYPNPSNGQFYLLTDSDLNLHLNITVSDLLGQKYHSLSIDPSGKINIEPVDITDLPAGTYILYLRVKEHNTSHEKLFNSKITIVK